MTACSRTLTQIAREYPPELIPRQLEDIDRALFHLSLIGDTPGRLCDLGGGIGLFPVACAALGWSVVVADDFGDAVNQAYGHQLPVHDKYGVDMMSADVLAEQLPFPRVSFDAITSIDSMEHWHQSPKRLFCDVMALLKPGGRFILGVPNAVDLVKRITVPLGIAAWSTMHDWYELPAFRGHVREPSVADLRYIARDMGLVNVRILGRNWTAYRTPRRVVRRIAPYADRLLRPFPALCSDIYLVGQKPH